MALLDMNLWHCAVRHYSHMHAIELGQDPKVKSVAKLVATV